jgi:nucleoside-diphosphate-sugar epimerase
MKKTIVVAGATGNLGQRIVLHLIEQGAEVRAIVRPSSDIEKIKKLEQLGVKVFQINMMNVEEVTDACKNASCVVSAISGLKEVIIDTQKILLDGAILAGVPRFIPSDYSLDFLKFRDGENRNLDWRRTFHQYLDKKPISATTIFNGAFADMLTNEMPMIIFKRQLVLYWGNADHRMSFTTIADTAKFTAFAALDDSTPRYLRIAGDQISPHEIRTIMNDVSGQKFRLIRTGGQGMLGLIIKIARKFAPAENELYPAWQGMQYMHNMIDDRSNMDAIDKNRYPSIRWTNVRDVLTAFQK